MTSDNLGLSEIDPAGVASRVAEMADLLKVLGNEGRLGILCHLTSGPKSVAELEGLLSLGPDAVSQFLSRLRLEKLVETRREGNSIYYSIRDPRVRDLLMLLDRLTRKAGPGEA